MRGILIAAGLVLLTVPGVAAASPDDPYGDDFVAIAVNPMTGIADYGGAGTESGAVEVAMTICNNAHGPCVVAETMHHGCVAVVFNHETSMWAGGRGGTSDEAMQDAVAKLPAQGSHMTGGGHCST